MSEWQISGLELWQWQQVAKQQAIMAEVPISEVDWLLQEVAGLDRLTLRLESFREQAHIPLKMPLETLTHLWEQRTDARVPLQYLVGVAPWRQFLLTVAPTVLIPRPETECVIDLVKAATQASPDLQAGHWADLGTGSGAIALGLADSFAQASIHAVDCSSDALAVAQQNAQRYGMGDRIRFYQGSWFAPLVALKGDLSGMVSNPPYIPASMISELQSEVVLHEPHLALDGGADGLDCIRHLVQTAPDYLRSGGLWLVEMMAGQAEAVVELLHQGSYRDIQIHADLAGIDRFALAYRL